MDARRLRGRYAGVGIPHPLEYVLFLPSGTLPVSKTPDPNGNHRPEQTEEPVPSRITRFLRVVEWLGNALPHPVTLFALFALSVVLFSGLMGALGVAVPDPRPEGAAGRAADGMIRVVSLLNAEGFRRIVQNLVTNFTSFVPLGTVLVAMLGVGVAERSGLLTAAVRAMVLNASPSMVTVTIVFAAVLSNTASEMGYVVLVPLAAMIYYSLGRHPLAGLAAGFAGVSGGYSANLLVGTVDPLLAGITQEAARLIAPEYLVDATANWFFMIGSTFVVVLVVSLISLKIVEPALGPYDRSQAKLVADDMSSMEGLSDTERRGLRYAGLAALLMVGLIALLVVPEGAVLRNPETGAIKGSPFLRGFVAIIFVFFLVPGITYGAVVGTMRSDRDVIDAMAGAMSTLGLYMVLVFFAAQFVAFFSWTNLGAVTAVTGAEFLTSIGLTGPLVFVFFILMCGFVNLMLGSASAQWAVTAPIFVPMLMLLGYSPEVIQAAYRIGDSTTNIITPMMSYFGLIMAFAARYVPKAGIGTLISMMLPYSVALLVCWTAFFFLWVFVLGLPVGPASPTYFAP
ncbi:AbgT family transporter [Wenzhouxiangella sp. XN24]|nr:AbgT family transporter [Wenzhouxiangella sp. XN24]NGX15111.1 AbgT family transporter [Wenzhouxiangella sp. XN24]